LHICRHSDSLLFQFIMSEFLNAYPAVRKVEALHADLEKDESGDPINGLLEVLRELVGALPEEAAHAPWTRNQGILAYLKHYCACYHAALPEAAELRATASQAFHAALSARDLLWQIALPPDEERYSLDLAYFSRLIWRLVAHMDRFSEELQSLLPKYKRDENVLYFLLQQNDSLLKAFPSDFLSSLLKEMFQGGVSDANVYLQDRYHQRGFDHLLPSIADLLSQIGE
jgi:hypothetical protein